MLPLFNIGNYIKDENVEEHVPFKVQEYNWIFIKLCLLAMLKIHWRMKLLRKPLILFPSLFSKDLVVPWDPAYDYSLP